MAIRRVERELEAKLEPVLRDGEFASSRGKLERKSYAGGSQRLKISLRKLSVPDGTTVQVQVDARPLASISIENGRGEFDRESKNQSDVPAMEVGETVTVLLEGTTVMSGALYED